MNLKDIMLSEISQSQKNNTVSFNLFQVLKSGQIQRDRKQISGYQELG